MIEKFSRPANLNKGLRDQFYFRVRARNGKIVAQSEGYNTKRARDNGIKALLRVTFHSSIYDCKDLDDK